MRRAIEFVLNKIQTFSITDHVTRQTLSVYTRRTYKNLMMAGNSKENSTFGGQTPRQTYVKHFNYMTVLSSWLMPIFDRDATLFQCSPNVYKTTLSHVVLFNHKLSSCHMNSPNYAHTCSSADTSSASHPVGQTYNNQ